MGIYQRYVLPRVVHLTCSLKPTMKQREKVVPLAEGRVLEVGIGSGLNLPFYTPDKVQHVWGLDPSKEMWALAKKKVGIVDFDVEFIEAAAEEMPLDDSSADTVLVTYTLCTIPEALLALAEMRRVLKQSGQLLFCEHGAAPDEGVQRWQNRLNPIWKRLGGGCNLNRPIATLIEQAGFKIRGMDTMYLPGWRPASFNYWGTASRC
ncbi:class I SAM-dependent methyltransferase [Acidobacteria bacterium AH-259-O06]|nr:class I SAM-dependent methyltransferase [Acidobacteria bacterium AH-259-O06]